MSIARPVVSLASGALFGAGLVVSGMTDPAKVQGFLDVTGKWDPSLAFVMGAAVLTCAVFSFLARRRGVPLLDVRFAALERATLVDRRLLTGAAVFGVGWGLCGVCPGPAIVSLGTTGIWPLVFVAAMAVGSRLEGALAVGEPRRVSCG